MVKTTSMQVFYRTVKFMQSFPKRLTQAKRMEIDNMSLIYSELRKPSSLFAI